MTLRLRRAVQQDTIWLAEFGERTFRAAYGHLIPPDSMDSYCVEHYGRPQQATEILSPDGLVLLAELDGTRVGFAYVTRDPDRETPPCVTASDAATLARLYVDPAHQSAGIGAALIEGAVTEARGMGASMLWLAVWQENPRAIAFYQRHGFTEIGRAGFPTDPDPECDLIMARWIESC